MKSTLQRLFPQAYEALMRQYAKRMPRSELFSKIYRENGWNDPESRSGVGSRMEETRVIRSVLPGLLRELDVQTLLDAPCGDRNWIRHVDLGAIDYLGVDIVPELIADNTRQFTQCRFQVLDLVTAQVPRVDLVICRDCLVHLSLRDAMQALRNIAASGSKYLLTTTFDFPGPNTDIVIGWRRLNLQMPPFSLPEPLRLIDEHSSEQSDKRLGLWDLRAL